MSTAVETSAPASTGVSVPPALTALADYVHAISFDQIPIPVVDRAKRLLLDGISWMVMGVRREEARRLIESQTSTGAASGCTIVGTDRRAVFSDAVRLNSALAQVHDCNDGRRLANRDGGSNHPGRGVVPVALSLGQHYHLSGKSLIELLVLGYEAVSRVQVPIPDLEYSYGVAAMLSRAAGFGLPQTTHALALAHLSFPVQSHWSTDTDFDFLRLGLIIGSAVSAVSWASADLSLPLDRCQINVAGHLPPVDDADGSGYAMMAIYTKPYPCCRALHPAIDVALALRSTGEFTASQIASVEVRLGLSKEFQFRPVGPGAYYKSCQFSVPYTIACALLDGAVSEYSFSSDRIARSDVQDLQRRISAFHDPKLAYNPNGPTGVARPAVVILTTRDGRRFQRSTLFPKGSHVNPFTADELHAKFRDWTTPSFTQAQQDYIIELVESLDTVSDVSVLTESLATS